MVVLPVAAWPLVWWWEGLVASWMPGKYGTEGWSLYPYALGGLVGGSLAAWGLRHRWVGLAYGAGLGVWHGGWLFLAHGALGFMGYQDSGPSCVLMGDRTAGILFFVLSVVGACLGTRVACGEVALLSGPVTLKRVGAWVAVLCAMAGFWVGLFYLTPAFHGY